MNYPLNLSFKKIAIARQLSVRDARGQLLLYVKQKAFKLREESTVFADAEQRQPLYVIRADRVIDFSARYDITDASGGRLGSVQRQGMKSFWRAHYDIAGANGDTLMNVSEENPWTKVLDQLIGEIPVVGIFTGYLFHPAYLVARSDGSVLLRMQKQPALFESKFQITRQTPLDEDQERLALLALVVTVLLERSRG